MIGSLRTNRQPRNCAGVRLLIDRYIKLRLHGSQFNFVDAFAAFRDWEIQNPDEASEFTQGLEKEAVTEFAKNPITANLVRDLAFAYFRPEQFPSHSALIEQLLYNPGGAREKLAEPGKTGGAREREESDRVGAQGIDWRYHKSRCSPKSCLMLLFGNKLLHSAIWNHGITPKYTYTVTTPHDTSGNAESVGNAFPNAQILVDIPKQEGKGKPTFWYQVVPMVNGVKQDPIYRSSRLTNHPPAEQ